MDPCARAGIGHDVLWVYQRSQISTTKQSLVNNVFCWTHTTERHYPPSLGNHHQPVWCLLDNWGYDLMEEWLYEILMHPQATYVTPLLPVNLYRQTCFSNWSLSLIWYFWLKKFCCLDCWVDETHTLRVSRIFFPGLFFSFIRGAGYKCFLGFSVIHLIGMRTLE